MSLDTIAFKMDSEKFNSIKKSFPHSLQKEKAKREEAFCKRCGIRIPDALSPLNDYFAPVRFGRMNRRPVGQEQKAADKFLNKRQQKLEERQEYEMGKVVSINQGRFLGSYIEAENSERRLDALCFFTGVMVSMVLPQIIFSVYGGFVPVIAFVCSALTGVLLGFVIYRFSPHRTLSCVGTSSVPQAPSGVAVRLKAA
jgi:hypothetical protein